MEKKKSVESIESSETLLYNLWNIDCSLRMGMMIFDIWVFQVFFIHFQWFQLTMNSCTRVVWKVSDLNMKMAALVNES